MQDRPVAVPAYVHFGSPKSHDALVRYLEVNRRARKRTAASTRPTTPGAGAGAGERVNRDGHNTSRIALRIRASGTASNTPTIPSVRGRSSAPRTTTGGSPTASPTIFGAGVALEVHQHRVDHDDADHYGNPIDSANRAGEIDRDRAAE